MEDLRCQSLRISETIQFFLYKDYSVEYIESAYRIVYHFEIPGLCEFQSKWEFPAKERVDETILKALAFHLGMAETISYWKCACPKQLKILCGTLSAEQKKWWKKLYYNGLGEFMYRNGIVVSKEDLVTIECEDKACAPLHDTQSYDGCAGVCRQVERIPWFPLRC